MPVELHFDYELNTLLNLEKGCWIITPDCLASHYPVQGEGLCGKVFKQNQLVFQ